MTAIRPSLRSRGVCLAALCASAIAQAPAPTFAPPVRLRAGDTLLGEKRLFPSPVFHDVDGDGRLDVVVGDLPGRITWARGLSAGDAKAPPQFAAEQKLLDRDGQPLDFHNW